MKQQIKLDDNYNEIEYHELDDNGNILYSKYTSYYYDKSSWTNANTIFEVRDSNGWIRRYNPNGTMFHESGSPHIITQVPHSMLPIDPDDTLAYPVRYPNVVGFAL